MLPIRHWYASAQSGAPTRANYYPEPFALRLGDLRAPAPTSTYLKQAPFMDHEVLVRSSENFAYIGTFVLAFVPIVIALVLYRHGETRWIRNRRDLLAVSLIGLFAFSIALGRVTIAGVQMPFYDMFVLVLPGLDSVVALVRLAVFAQLGLVLIACVGFEQVLLRIPARRARSALALSFLAIVGLEGSVEHQMVEVVAPAHGSVYEAMQELPSGVAIELPMAPRSLAGTYAFLEATRMLLGSDDRLQTVNGYSGYAPIDYEQTIERANGFPSAESLDELTRLDVSYVILHAAPMDTGMDVVTQVVNDTGFASYSPPDVERILSEIPSDLSTQTIRADDGVIIVISRPAG